MNSSYFCKISNIGDLHYFSSENVRWLDPDSDYDLIKDYFRYFDVIDITDTYFGISLNNIKREWSYDQIRKGRLCAYISDNEILSFAGVEYISSDMWEIRAVSSRPDCNNKGYSKCVCSFIAKYILEQGRQAICETNISNYAMQKVTKLIGMVQYHP